jgi:DNA-binding SARP family transcriptional activator
MSDALSGPGIATGRLALFTLGTPRLEIESTNGGLKASIGPGKPLALFTYLAFAPRRVASRERLCDLLWGDRDADEARGQLRQALWMLRRQLGATALESRADGIAIVAPADTDADAFAADVEAGELEGAERRYAGEFFAGFASPGAAEFERWAELERGRLRSLYVHIAESLARRALDSGRFAEAASVARRLRDADPFGETGWRLLLETLTSAGDSLGARAEADHFEHWLRIEERDPEPASRAALRSARQVARATDTGHHDTDLVAALVGREREFAEVQRLWNEAKGKGTRRVHVTGESGIGKTRLLLDLCARLRAQRASVVYRRASPGERYIPFAFGASLAAALAELPGAVGVSAHAASSLLALNPSLSSAFRGAPDFVTGDEALRRRALALLELVAAVTDESPVAIFIDDLHWCDPQSQQMVALVTARLSTERVLFVTAARPHHAIPMLPDETVRIALVALHGSQVEEMVVSLGTLPAAPWACTLVAALASSVRGNPLLVTEALKLCIDKGVLRRSNDGWSCSAPELLAPTLQYGLVIGRRLRELGEIERHFLLLVALAAGPIPLAMVAEAAGVALANAESGVMRLEARGLIAAFAGSVSTAHDEISDASVADASSQEIQSAQAALGRVMASSNDAQWKRRAVPHLADAGEWRLVPGVAAAILKRSRVPSLSLDDQIGALLGANASASHVAAVRARLPFALRHPRGLHGAMLTAGVMIATAGIAWSGFGADRANDSADAVLLVRDSSATGAVRGERLEIHAAEWDPSRSLVPTGAGAPRPAPRFDDVRSVQRPGTDEWVDQVESPDSGGVDLELRDARGHRERLTWSPADDKGPAFSPDGSLLAFSSSRWSALGHPNLAIMEPRTKAVRRLTVGAASDERARWSRDGTRIAFVRHDADRATFRLCWISVDGARERCPDTHRWHVLDLFGWTSDTLVLALADSIAGSAMVLVNVNSGAVTRTELSANRDYLLDPTGQWVIERAAGGDRVVASRVGAVTRFSRARSIAREDSNSVARVWWESKSPAGYLDRVRIEHPPGPLAVATPHLLALKGWAKSGAPMEPQAVRWRSLDERIARIDSVGVLIARDTGRAVIEATAGGWRTVRDTVAIGAARESVVMDERWSDDWGERWRMFGEPLPAVVATPHNGHAFLNRGDGTFFSGAYSLRAFDASGGLAIDMELSTPITRSQWQVIIAYLFSMDSDARLARWDHRSGYFPEVDRGPVACSFEYPEGEGTDAKLTASPLGLIADAPEGVPKRLDGGAWYRLRIQVLPDGRCGYALNGVPLHISAGSHAPTHPIRIMLEGSSVGTQVLVGRLTVTEGVPADVDWTHLRMDGEVWRPARKP